MLVKKISRPMICLLLLAGLVVGCSRPPGPLQLSAALTRKMSSVHSYEFAFELSGPDQSFAVVQWYRAPDQVRTEVTQAGQPVYLFFYSAGQLVSEHVPSGQRQDLTLSESNQLFVRPLLLDFCQEAARFAWTTDPAGRLYCSSFQWQGGNSVSRSGQMWVDSQTLLPTEIRLLLPEGHHVCIIAERVAINPPLADTLFSFPGK